ncbi:MAG: corrinoid protein [Bacillota bacterium]|nr:corrinoid protein [Bacillota bacterium]HHT90652.1 cobalamin-binding protein [Bacillota bacterium]
MEMVLQDINQALQRGDVNGVKQGIQEALDSDMKPRVILNEGLLSAMETIGVKFKNNEVFVPEVLIAARAMNAGMELLKPKLVETGVEPVGTAVLGTVKGDLHDIGKNLVRMMLEGAGLTVYDLGVDVSAEQFVAAIQEHDPHIVGLSALLTTTMGEMKSVIQAIEEAGLRDKVKIMVGGAPVTSKFAVDIGADVYAKDAAEASTEAKKLVQ